LGGAGGVLMGRREFFTVVGVAAAGWPLTARAQQPAKVPTIGFLAAGSHSTQRAWYAALADRLRELGWIEDLTVAIEYRWAEGRSERYAEIAAEFVRLRVDVIVTTGSGVLAAKQATSVIPIVFALSGDPVGTGFVTSLARPGGNVTGLSQQMPDVAGKRIELLREIIPGLRRLAIMVNVSIGLGALDAREAEAAARTLGLDVVMLEIKRAEDIMPALKSLKERADALYVVADALLYDNGDRIHALALDARMATVHSFRELVEAGGLLSYGPNATNEFRRAGDYVDKLLGGAKPSDLPVEQATKFDLVINLKIAKALGLTVPQSLLARADEVIE